ncbi:glycosyltransferase [Streptomyces scopuliridis]|uniref:glycosyltransferase n=1 Tax=Streptomyces scopuliridis TaxID=452529 RepID=UPI00398D5EEB
MHASLTLQSAPWEALITLDGASPGRLPAPLAKDPRIRTLAPPRPVGAACARNLALTHVRTPCTNWADDDDVLPAGSLEVRYQRITETGLRRALQRLRPRSPYLAA